VDLQDLFKNIDLYLS